jgi:hypothetical protein
MTAACKVSRLNAELTIELLLSTFGQYPTRQMNWIPWESEDLIFLPHAIPESHYYCNWVRICH